MSLPDEYIPEELWSRLLFVLSYGAHKHSPRGWMRRGGHEDALRRHVDAAQRGGRDPDTGESHWVHVAARALFLAWEDGE